MTHKGEPSQTSEFKCTQIFTDKKWRAAVPCRRNKKEFVVGVVHDLDQNQMEDAKTFVENIRQEIEASRDSRLWKDSVNMLSTVSESIFSRSAHFILELLQNAEDAGQLSTNAKGEIKFCISKERVKVIHNGAPFKEANVNAICGVRSTKKPVEGTLGFLGIGFKSVFKITDCPQIHSGNFHFKFDKQAFTDAINEPWQIMPFWVDKPLEPLDEDKTTFIFQFRSAELYEQIRDELKKLDVHIFLFLRWLKKLEIVDEATGEPPTTIECGDPRDEVLVVKKDGKPRHFAIFRRTCDVPPEVSSDPALEFYKRQSVRQREVVIAFSVDEENNLLPMEDASALGSVSSFLPLVEERSGAKFLVQADFLVQPGREAIQYEIKWNHWLVDQTTWKRQFLPVFKFVSFDGQPAFEKLFKPMLHDKLIGFLKDADIFPTASGIHVKPALVVHPVQSLRGLIDDADLPALFWNGKGLHLSEETIDLETLPREIADAVQKTDLAQVARTKSLLDKRAEAKNTEWFAQLYAAMADTGLVYKWQLGRTPRGRITSYDSPIYILTEKHGMISANDVYLRDIPPQVLELRDKFPEVGKLLDSYKLLHPTLQTPELAVFFKEHTHVRAIDYDKICREVFLPKVRVFAEKPSKEDVLAYTRLLQKGPPIHEEIWVLTKTGDIKPSRQVFLAASYLPAENWEKHSQFSPQIQFLAADYLVEVSKDSIPVWKDFFVRTGVQEKGENSHVESFATNFVKDKLSDTLHDFESKERQRVGYDFEARRKLNNELVKLEVKGQKQEFPVPLAGNEPRAAQYAKESGGHFWVCIVPHIPEDPELWVVENATEVGEYDTLKISVSGWKTHGRRVV
jgi:hypothetical protein